MKPSAFWYMLTPRERKLILWVSGLLLFYTIAGFLILPPIIRSVAVRQIHQQLDREVSIQKVKLNPFTLSATVDGLLIKDKDGEPFVSWEEAYVNFQLSSFFTGAWTFKEISAIKPYVRAQLNKDGTYNFTDLITKFTTNAPAAKPKAPSKPLALHIDHLHITGAAVSVVDYTSRVPFKRTLGPLNINLEDFRTDPDNKNPYAFAGTTDAGERISWSGFFYLNPLRSSGNLTLDHLTLNKYSPLYQDLVRFEIRSGSIGMHVKYHFEFSPTNRVTTVDNAAFALRDLKIGQPGDTSHITELENLAVVGAAADLQSHQVSVDAIRVTGARAFLSRDKNAKINVVELSKPPVTAAAPSDGVMLLLRSVTNAVAMLLTTTNEWSATIHSVEMTNCALHWEDHVNSRPAALDLQHITLSVKNISNLPGTNLTATLSLDWNTNGSINAGVNALFYPPTADMTLSLSNLSLSTLDPYLEPKVNLLVLGSKIGLDGAIHLHTPVDQLPELTFQGNVRLDDFHTVDGTMGEDLLKWDSIRFTGIAANLNPETVAIKQINVDDLCARVVVNTNHEINLMSALRSTNAPAVAKEPKEMKPPKKVKTKELASTPASPTNAPALPEISVDSVVISNAQFSFTDYSTKPEVNMGIEQVNGTINGISTKELQHADIDIHALIDGVGPADITGHINPFSGKLTNSIKISIKDVDLTPASPYAGEFAGYKIARGKLNLDLTYEIVGKNVSAKNVIMLDQFTFGEKVDSPNATHLPVRLAVAVLKDREGKIILDVPVQGHIDDPEIRTGKVIRRALLDILTEVATSPFLLLGAVFGGGGEELGYQDFAPGSAELTDVSRNKLDSLIKGLYERPGLSLEIAGSVDSMNDRTGLQKAAIEQQIRTRQWHSLSRSERSATTPDQITLTPDEHQTWVRTLYAEAVNSGKITPEFIASNTNLTVAAAQIRARNKTTPEKGATLLMTRRPPSQNASSSNGNANTTAVALPPADPMEYVLWATVPVSQSDLETLAARRAQTVQTYILQTGKVDASRLFLTANGPAGLRHDGCRVYLQFR